MLVVIEPIAGFELDLWPQIQLSVNTSLLVLFLGSSFFLYRLGSLFPSCLIPLLPYALPAAPWCHHCGLPTGAHLELKLSWLSCTAEVCAAVYLFMYPCICMFPCVSRAVCFLCICMCYSLGVLACPRCTGAPGRCSYPGGLTCVACTFLAVI